MRELPLIAPNVPALSGMIEGLRAIERSGIYSNGGPVVRRFEATALERLYGGEGACLAVSNATLGLSIALRDAAGVQPSGRMALMPAFTFAATAHAAQWAGLTPLLCDIGPDDWTMAAAAEEALLRRFGERIAAIMPYATFGAAIDLERYAWLGARYGAAVIVDAAASLGTIDAAGRAFGRGARFAIVQSMHATKTFAVGEGALIYSADAELIERLRVMTNFGFGATRSATMSGTNAKLPEVMGLVALAKLDELDVIADRRATLDAAYRTGLAGFTFQRPTARRQAMQFMPVLLPEAARPHRAAIIAALAGEGIGSGAYFSPHLGEQPWFAGSCIAEPTPVADAISAGMLSLPITDAMDVADVARICAALRSACAVIPGARTVAARPRGAEQRETVLIGGGPAGTAILLAAAKRGRFDALAPGLALIERGTAIGAGRLGGYAITSDSSAETFLTAVRDSAHPELAALSAHPAAAAVARHAGELGVPLFETGPFLAAAGQTLKGMVEARGGTVATGTEALRVERLSAHRWRTRLRTVATGEERVVESHNVVIATGGWQPPEVTAQAIVGGVALGDHADRVVRSDEVLRVGGLAQVRGRLSGIPAPRVAIVGGSTSALAVAALLLRSSPAAPLALGTGAVTLLHRGALRPFYPSADAARADGYDDFGPRDICPVSGFVYRLAGFRLEARALLLRMLAIGGRAPDPRLHLHRLDDAGAADPVARDRLGRADLIVAALGYRPRAIPVVDIDGTAIPLAVDGGIPLVDRYCRVRDAAGRTLPGLFGVGLAAGFVPWGPLGGEASFRGQANGLWLWQNDVGAMIVDGVLARHEPGDDAVPRRSTG